MKMTAQLSSKGQVVIPKNVRDSRHWQAGTEFIIEEEAEGIFLKPIPSFPPTRLKDVVGCAHYTGPKISLKAMKLAIITEAKKQR